MVFEGADWIWHSWKTVENEYTLFRREFTAPRGAGKLYLSVDGQYSATLNGKPVGEGQYADYPEYKVYDALDVSFAEGINTLEIAVWRPGVDCSVYRAGMPGLIFSVLSESGARLCASDEKTLCAPHPNYRNGQIEFITHQLGFTFAYDACADAPAFVPSVRTEGPQDLCPRPVPKLVRLPRAKCSLVTGGFFTDAGKGTYAERMQYAALSYLPLHELTGLRSRPAFPSDSGVTFRADGGDGVYVLLDLGQEDAGLTDIDIELPEEAEVLIGWGEHTKDLRLRTYVGRRNFAARLRLPKGRTRFVNPMRRLGLRYMALYVYAHSFCLYYAGIQPTVYPVSEVPKFHVSDRLHQMIYETSVRTLRTCMHEHYEDCPWREQALYTMDSRNQMLCGYYALGEYDMPRASIRLLALGLREDRLLELCAPARVPVTIPSFTAMFIVQLEEYYLYSGDRDFALEMLPTARTVADGLLSGIDHTGLVPARDREGIWNFYEWTEGLDGQTAPTPAQGQKRYDAPMAAFTVLALRRLAQLEKWLGLDGTNDESAAEALAKRAHAAFYDEERSYYRSYLLNEERLGADELTQALMVCAGICPEENLDGVLRALSSQKLKPITLSYSIFQFDALMKRPKQYGRWVFERIARDWGHMLRSGATTFWETILGDADFDDAGSLCHGWSAVPVYCYFAYALGLKPTRPGFVCDGPDPVDSGLYELRGCCVKRDGSTVAIEDGRLSQDR